MSSISYTTDVCSNVILDLPPPLIIEFPDVMIPPSTISGLDGDTSTNDGSKSPKSAFTERKIIVANFLPLHSLKDEKTGQWSFFWDEDSLLLQMKDGFSSEAEVVYVGSLKVAVDRSEEEKLSKILLEDFKCIPTFLSPELLEKYYHGFCKHQLWPLFHYMLPHSLYKSGLFDQSLFQAYVCANLTYAKKVMEATNSNEDVVWIHDYHLMLVPTFFRKRMYRAKIGFFLHSPFPSSEIFRTLPVREEILKGLLNADLIGFHTFDYARHFLSCCSRMLGINYESKRGYLELEYVGRTVGIKILPVGVNVGRLQSVLSLPSTISKVQEIEDKFKGKKLFLGIDDMDIFKGISLKLLALEHLLESNPGLKGKIVLVQIINPARSMGKDVEDARTEAVYTAERINFHYGSHGYQPVILINRFIPFYEKIAYYAASDCCIVNAVRDGMNLVPYEYIVCRQGTEEMDRERGIDSASPRTSTLIVSEFVGCSPSLSGAFRVNPWSTEDVAHALYKAAIIPEFDRQLRHEKHYRYVRDHNVAYWARSFLQDLERACRNHYNLRFCGLGLGLGFRCSALSPDFRELKDGHIVESYERTSRRAIFLDYDGTLMPDSNFSDKSPSKEVINILNDLCSDPKNTVFIVSGRGRAPLDEWFSSCESLGIASEHGYFIRRSKASTWESSTVFVEADWMKIVEPVMRLYTETTDGSYIEAKESALVWHRGHSDFDFGKCQEKELLDHLQSVLANEPVDVRKGLRIVEVKPQGVSKGLVVKKLLGEMAGNGNPADFVMCIGDDRSDEDMFEIVNRTATGELPPEVFACTVGHKPSKAKYYVDDTEAVIELLEDMASASTQKPKATTITDARDFLGGDSCWRTEPRILYILSVILYWILEVRRRGNEIV